MQEALTIVRDVAVITLTVIIIVGGLVVAAAFITDLLAYFLNRRQR